MDILRTLTVGCVAGWLAISAFFSFAVAPLAFKTIDRTVAGQLVAAVLPRYYDWGVVLCAVALIAATILAISGPRPRWRALLGVALCGAMVGLLLWASVVLLPRAEAAVPSSITDVSIEVVRNASSGFIASTAAAEGGGSTSLPTFFTSCGTMRLPPAASVAYALVSSIGDTTEVPSARLGFASSSLSTPASCASRATAASPSRVVHSVSAR